MPTLILLSSIILMAVAIGALAGIMEVWGSRIRIKMPGGLHHAMTAPEVYRGADNLLVIPDNEHYDAVTVKRWGAVIWHSMADRTVYFTDPNRAFTIVPRGTAAYRLIVALVNRAPVASAVREPSYWDGF